jgi:hypothetical protein
VWRVGRGQRGGCRCGAKLGGSASEEQDVDLRGGGGGLGLAATTITGSTTARGDKRGGRNGVEGSRLGGSGSGVGGGRNQGVGPIWEIGIKGWVGYGSSIKDGVGLWRGGKGGQG